MFSIPESKDEAVSCMLHSQAGAMLMQLLLDRWCCKATAGTAMNHGRLRWLLRLAQVKVSAAALLGQVKQLKGAKKAKKVCSQYSRQ